MSALRRTRISALKDSGAVVKGRKAGVGVDVGGGGSPCTEYLEVTLHRYMKLQSRLILNIPEGLRNRSLPSEETVSDRGSAFTPLSPASSH